MRFAPVLTLIILASNAIVSEAAEPIFVPIKIDGPVHDPARGTFWYGPFAEGCAVLDMNGDGLLDLTAGKNWYEAPSWRKHEGYRDGADRSGEFISDNGEYPLDVNGDGLLDLISAGWMSNGVFWYENSGQPGVKWRAHKIIDSIWTEGLIVEDVEGDGDEDIVVDHWGPHPEQGLYWIENLTRGEFRRHNLGSEGDHHGVGLGDLNGDGRKDIVTAKGWYEAPEDRSADEWDFHADYSTDMHLGIRMLVVDVNADGRSDIICGNGHGYGLFWLEQTTGRNAQSLTFQHHAIEDSLGQFHTLVLADVNQDGTPDLVTGKRLRGHNGSDPSAFDPLGVFWYELAGGRFRRHVLSYNNLPWFEGAEERNPPPNFAIGTGMNIHVVDMNGDGRVDIVVAGKSGLYLFENRGLPPTEKMIPPDAADN